MKDYPFIDPKALHIGISKLRDMDTAWLRDFAASDEIVVLQTGEEPLGVMVPYALFQRMQAQINTLRDLNARLQMKMSLNADEAVAEQQRLQAHAPQGWESIAGMIEQFCRDLNDAHNEILRAQGVAPEDFGKYDWPEWSGPANSIRWAEKLLGKRLAKTALWSTVPNMCRCPDGQCYLHPGSTTCSLRAPSAALPSPPVGGREK